MTECSIVKDRLLFYLLGELSPEEMIEAGDHLRECVSCTMEMNALAADVMKIRSAFTAVPEGPDRSLADRILAQLPASRPSRRTRWPYAAALAACLVVAALMSLLIPYLAPARTVKVAGFVADHLEYLGKKNPAQIASADAEVVAGWLSGRLGFPVSAIDLSHRGAKLLGGRRCELNGVSLAFLFYQKDKTRISIYEIHKARVDLESLPSRICNGHRLHLGQYGDFRLVACRLGDRTLVVVAQLDEEELIRIAQDASMLPVADASRL